MKRIFLIILALIMCFSIIACDGNKKETKSIEDKVRSAVESRIIVEIGYTYDTVGVPNCTYYIDKIDDNNFKVTGKVTVKDKYGDTYTGKYDAEVTYNPTTDECTAFLDLDKLYKN